MHAVIHPNNMQTIDFLLEAKADANLVSTNGDVRGPRFVVAPSPDFASCLPQIALKLAVRFSQLDVAKRLLESKADQMQGNSVRTVTYLGHLTTFWPCRARCDTRCSRDKSLRRVSCSRRAVSFRTGLRLILHLRAAQRRPQRNWRAD